MINSTSLHSFTTNSHGREAIQSSLGVTDSTGAFSFSASPLGFISPSQCDTNGAPRVFAFWKETAVEGLLEKWRRKDSLYAARRYYLQHPVDRRRFVSEIEPIASSRVGFKVRSYKSGEITGGQFATGKQFKSIPSPRLGSLFTEQLTQRAKTKIRRAVECSDTPLKYFCTLTFSPSHLKQWHLSEAGAVRHDFAKWKIRKFLKACRMQQSRLNRDLNYLWVAELQENTGNIHFHIIWDKYFPIKWLTKIWAQAANSVDIDTVKSVDHAAVYLRKYLSKGTNQTIQGNRYFMAHKLREDIKPQERMLIQMSRKDHIEEDGERLREFREVLDAMKEDIESRGGKVLDFGFYISRPRLKRKYTDKVTGEEKETRGVDPRLHKQVVSILASLNDSNRRHAANTPF